MTEFRKTVGTGISTLVRLWHEGQSRLGMHRVDTVHILRLARAARREVVWTESRITKAHKVLHFAPDRSFKRCACLAPEYLTADLRPRRVDLA